MYIIEGSSLNDTGWPLEHFSPSITRYVADDWELDMPVRLFQFAHITQPLWLRHYACNKIYQLVIFKLFLIGNKVVNCKLLIRYFNRTQLTQMAINQRFFNQLLTAVTMYCIKTNQSCQQPIMCNKSQPNWSELQDRDPQFRTHAHGRPWTSQSTAKATLIFLKCVASLGLALWWAQLTKKLAVITDNPLTQKLLR